MLFMIASSSGLPLDHIFLACLREPELRGFMSESRIYLRARIAGLSWEESLRLLERRALSSRYKKFIRGLVNAAMTSLRVPDYIDSFHESYLTELEMRWRHYWSRLEILLESVMLLTLGAVTILLASVFTGTELIGPLIFATSAAIAFTGMLGVYMAKAMRPIDRLTFISPFKAYIWGAIPWLVALILLLLEMGKSLQMAAFSLTLIVGGMPFLIGLRRARRDEEDYMMRFHKAVELVKAGYSVYMAFEESGLTEDKPSREGYARPFLVRYIRFIVLNLKKYGAMNNDIVLRLYDRMERIIEIEKYNRRNMAFFATVGALLPTLLAYLSIRFVGLLSMGPYILEGLSTVFLSMAVAIGLLLSEAVDGSILSSGRVGITSAGLAAVFLLAV